VQNKINVAIIVPGGIGTGKDSIGVPVMERIIKSLASDFNITVFQLYKVNQGFTVNGFDLIEVYSSNRTLKYLKLIYHFWRIQRKREIQIVHGFWTMPCGFLSVVIGKIFRIKSVVSVLGGDAIALPEIHYGQLRSPLYRKLIFRTLSEAHQVIVLTQYLIDNLKKYGFYREDIKVIPWGIDGSLFSYKEKSIARPVQFLHIANLHPVKDQVTLLRAFKIISDEIPAHLLIIGEGISEGRIKILIGEMNLQSKIEILKQLPYESLPAYYHQADVLLHTSLSEGQSEVVTEALSCGVLVCGTHVGLMADLAGQCCITVPIQDDKALAAQIINLLNNKQKQMQMRSSGLQWSKTYSLSWTCRQYATLYQQLLPNSNPRESR